MQERDGKHKVSLFVAPWHTSRSFMLMCLYLAASLGLIGVFSAENEVQPVLFKDIRFGFLVEFSQELLQRQNLHRT